MKKKIEFLVIFMIFQFLEMNEKKNHFIMKNKKFYGTEAKGYCPFEQAGGARRWLGAGWALAGRTGCAAGASVARRASGRGALAWRAGR